MAEAIRRWGPPIEVRSRDGERRAVDDDEGKRILLRVLRPDLADWIATANPVEVAAAVEAVLAEEGDAP